MSGALPALERRMLLALCCAAVSFRWLLALRTPLPGVDACFDLWVAARLADGDFAVLAERWWQPLWPLLLAPAVALGAPPFAAAQLGAAVLGGLVLVPVALAAERLRQGAALPAAVLAVAAAGPAVAAAMGSSTALHALLVACAALAAVARRWVLAAALVLPPLAAAAVATLPAPRPWFDELRLAAGAPLVLLPLALLPPRLFGALPLALVLLGVAATAVLLDAPSASTATFAPLLAVLAGAGITRLRLRVRDVLLCAAVAAEWHAAWTLLEPREAIAERAIARHFVRHAGPSERLASDSARVLWAAGQLPSPARDADEVLAAAARDEVTALVLGRALGQDATLRSVLAARFVRASLPPDLQDLVARRSLTVLQRR